MLVWLTKNHRLFMFFVVFDPSSLTMCINCSFLHLSQVTGLIWNNKVQVLQILIRQLKLQALQRQQQTSVSVGDVRESCKKG